MREFEMMRLNINQIENKVNILKGRLKNKKITTNKEKCKHGKLKKSVRTKKGGKRKCKKRKYTKRKRSRK